MPIVHIRGNFASGHFPPIGIIPDNSARADIRPKPDKSLFGKVVQIQLQAVLQTKTLPRSWHESVTFFRLANSGLEAPQLCD
jgi:hypothetical protein